MNKTSTNGSAKSKDYAEMRAAILRDLDGLRYEVDTMKKSAGCGSIGRRSTSSPVADAARSTPSWRPSGRTRMCAWS